MMYQKLHRTWSHGYLNHIPKFRKLFPELSKISTEELCNRFIELDLNFYTEKESKINVWIRITLPIAIITLIFMIMYLPFNFMIYGKWGYSLNDKNYLYNWFKQLKLLS